MSDQPNITASVLDGMPENLSLLGYADELQKRAAKEAFDWPSIDPVFSKIEEELNELREAVAHPEAATGKAREHVIEELGDVLFCCVNLARYLGISPDQAMKVANNKFERRFRYIEQAMKAEGKRLKDASLEEMNVHWDTAKEVEKD